MRNRSIDDDGAVAKTAAFIKKGFEMKRKKTLLLFYMNQLKK